MTDTIVARMYLAAAEAQAYNPKLVQVTLRVVSGKDEINKKWSEATPSGELKLGILNASAQQIFLGGEESPLGVLVGAEYEVTITRLPS